jgi:hypothetical protein
MIVLGDVLEHFEKNQARQFLDKCVVHTNRHLIVCIPLGEKWTQEAIYGNPYERHLSFWSFEEFEPFISNYKIFQYPPGPYGAFLIKKEDYIDYKTKKLRKDALADPLLQSPTTGLIRRIPSVHVTPGSPAREVHKKGLRTYQRLRAGRPRAPLLGDGR